MFERARRRIREDDERHAIEKRARDAVDDRRGARTDARQARARRARDLRLRDRRNRARRLGRSENKREPGATRRFDEIEIAAAAGNAEDRARASGAQALHDDVSNGGQRQRVSSRGGDD